MLPQAWRRVLGIIRILVAVSCLAAQLLFSSGSFTGPALLFTAYAVYAALSLFWRSLEDSGFALVALLIDVLLFWASASSPATQSYWISAVFFGFVLAECVLRQSWFRTVLIASVSIAFLQFASPIHAIYLIPAMVTGGLAAIVFALQRQFLEDRVSTALRQGVLYRYDAEKARESERQRIAADFHDGPLQSFISFQMRLQIVKKLMARDANSALEELVQLQEICKGQVNELRSFVRSMRPIDVEGSLSATLRRVVEQFQRDSGIVASFESTEFLEPAEPEVSLELLQIVREALYNTQKHSHASRVAVAIQKSDRTLEMSIEDNGSGFAFSGAYTLEELELLRLGPISIKRRVRSLGGEMVLESKPGAGAALRIRLGV